MVFGRGIAVFWGLEVPDLIGILTSSRFSSTLWSMSDLNVFIPLEPGKLQTLGSSPEKVHVVSKRTFVDREGCI